MQVNLVMFKRDGTRKDFQVTSAATVLGRGEDCGLRVPLLNVSRHHCEIILGEDELRVRDLGSSNGTYVNNRRINEGVLKAGDRLVLGPVIFTVQIDGAPEQIAPVPSEDEKAGEAEAAPEAEEPIVELQPDVPEPAVPGAEDSDPIAALEALARKDDEKEDG